MRSFHFLPKRKLRGMQKKQRGPLAPMTALRKKPEKNEMKN